MCPVDAMTIFSRQDDVSFVVCTASAVQNFAQTERPSQIGDASMEESRVFPPGDPILAVIHEVEGSRAQKKLHGCCKPSS